VAFGDIVQTAENDSNSTSSITVTPASTPTDGNLVLVAHVYNDNTNTRTAEPSPGATTYEQGTTAFAANPDLHLKVWWGIADSEPSSYSVTTSANEDHAILLIEIEGPFVADGDPDDDDNHVATDGGTGDTALPTDSITTTIADSILLAFVGFNQNDNNVGSWTNSFTEQEENAGASNIFANVAVATRLVTSTGTYDTEATASASCGWATILIGLAEGSSVTLQYLYPDGDQLSGGWETAPTAGQDLSDQIDEDPAVDTDYIYEDA